MKHLVVTVSIALTLTTAASAQTPAERAPSLKLPAIVLAGAETFDIISTQLAFKRGCIEGNPLFGKHPGPHALWTTKLLGTAGAIGAAFLLKNTGHPKAAQWFVYGASAAPATAGTLNTLNSCR